MEFECGHSIGKLSTGTRQEHICVSQNEERSLCAKGRDAAERRGQVHVQLQDRREDGGCSPLWESSSKHYAKSRLERGWKGWAQRTEAAARRCTARCQQRKSRVSAAQKSEKHGQCTATECWARSCSEGLQQKKLSANTKTEVEISRKKKKALHEQEKHKLCLEESRSRGMTWAGLKAESQGHTLETGRLHKVWGRSRSTNLARQEKKHVSNK